MLKWRKRIPVLVLAISILALGSIAFTDGVEGERPDYATMNAHRSTSAERFIHPNLTAKWEMEAEVLAKIEADEAAEQEELDKIAPRSTTKDHYTGIASLQHPVVQHDPRTVYLSEDFEGVDFPPLDWDTINTDPGYGFFANTFSGGGTVAALVTWHAAGYVQDEWLLTPFTDISGMDAANAKLEFWMLQGYSYPHDFKVYWSTDGVNFTEFWDSFGTGYPAHEWYYVALDISSLITEGTVMFGFQYYGEDADLFGLDDIAITDDAEATGRCCSGDPQAPTCTDDLTLAECDALGGSWINGGTCVDDPCPIPGEDDNCEDVTPENLPFTFVGNNEGATYDTYCQYFGDYPNSWFAFTIDECMDITLTYCGCPDGWGNGWLNLVTDCACPEGSLISGATYDFDCANGNPRIYWRLDAGTYYYPVMLDPGSGASGDWVIDVSGVACPPTTPGDDCSNPLVESIGLADLPYTIAGQTTCGRIDDYDATCLGYYDGGEDLIVELTITEDMDLNITLDAYGETYTGIAISDACPDNGGVCIAYSTSSSSSPHGMTGVSLLAGTYYMIIDTWPSPDCIPTLDILIEEAVISEGDNCDNPIKVDIPALPWSDVGQTTCGRGESVDDGCLGYYDGGDDIFYEVTVLSAVTVNITLDPKTTTYTGVALATDCSFTTCLGYSTSNSADPHGMKCLELDPGTYYMMVDTWPSPQCVDDFDLTISDTTCTALENDDCADAIEVNEVVDLAFSTDMATFDGLGTCQTAPNVWYCYTATQAGDAVVTLCGSDYDTKMAVYVGCSCDPLGTEVDCNDDSDCGKALQSTVVIPGVSPGETYLVEVGGYSSNTGDGILNIYVTEECDYECPAGATPEGETCIVDEGIDVTNGGCNSDPAVFGSIACGETVCGEVSTYLFDGGERRDTDWYGFTLDDWYEVTLDAEAGFPLVVGFLEQVVAGGGLDCSNFTGYIDPYSSVDECVPTSLTLTLGPGIYAIFAGTSVFSGYDCASGPHNYHLTLTCVPATPTYCDASGGCDEYIENVTVGDINNTTACEGYGDFTALSTTVEVEGTYPVSVTVGGGYYNDQGAVWVDWNQDYDFDDPGEEILTGTGYGPYTGDMVVPTDALSGETRMRVRLTYGGAPAPCGATSYGEAEDYTIIVGEAAPTFYLNPDPYYAAFLFALDPMSGAIYLTGTAAGGDVSTLTGASFDVGGCTFAATGLEVFPGGYGPLVEDAVKISFSLSDYLTCEAGLQPDGLLWDNIDSFFDITYEIDGAPGSFAGQVLVVGHVSGDLTMDGEVLVNDITFFVDYLFRGGDAPQLLEIADCDGSGGDPNVADITRLVSFLFKGGAAPVHP